MSWNLLSKKNFPLSARISVIFLFLRKVECALCSSSALCNLVMKQCKLSKYLTNFDSYKSCANIHFDQKWKPLFLVVLSNSCHFPPIGGLGSFTVYNPRIVLSYAYLLIWPGHLCKPLCRPYYQTLFAFNECRCFLKAEK